MKAKEKQEALKLRSKGFSYREILQKIKVSKSSLSLWLRNYELTEDQIERLKNISDRARERAANSIKDNWKKKRGEVYDRYDPPYGDSFFMLGLGIYMGEGSRYNLCSTELSNTNYRISLIFKHWIKKYFFKKGFMVKPRLNLYPDIDKNKAKKWWSNKLGIDIKEFGKSVVMISCASNGKRKNMLKYGTCKLILTGKENWKSRVKIQKALDFAPVM